MNPWPLIEFLKSELRGDIVLAFALSLLLPFHARAEDAKAVAENVPSAWVLVRTVEALGGGSPVAQSIAPKIDPRLSDIGEKLRKLHFKSFRLLSSQTQVVPLMKKGKLALINGDNLILRPLLVSPDRISMWLKWKDANGMEVLDTRMHFDPGESMLTGTDHSDESGVILAIEVKPAP